MARLKTAQPNPHCVKIAAVATAVSGIRVRSCNARRFNRKKKTITVTAAPAAQESAPGPPDHRREVFRHHHQN